MNVGRSSVVSVTDWEGDGDLDLVVGCCQGWVFLVPNGSGGKGLKFGKPARLSAAGTEIRAPGSNSGPVVADWDGDGRHDLLLGCGNGEVLWYRNTAESGAPVLAKPAVLLPISEDALPRSVGRETSPCGRDTKVAVHDWNGDGRPDLLVGDYSRTWRAKEDLGKEEVARLAALRTAAEKIAAKVSGYEEKNAARIDGEARKALGLPSDAPLEELVKGLTPDKRREYTFKRHAILRADPEHRKLQAQAERATRACRVFERSVLHGRVWLLTRGP